MVRQPLRYQRCSVLNVIVVCQWLYLVIICIWTWPNNDTDHWNVFFTKSNEGGKTLKTMTISAPNKGLTVDENTALIAGMTEQLAIPALLLFGLFSS